MLSTGLKTERLRDRVSKPDKGEKFSSSKKRPDLLWDAGNIFLNDKRGLFPGVKRLCAKLVNHTSYLKKK